MKVKVYSTAICPWCIRVKDFLKQHKIEFESVDVSSDKKAAEEMIEKTGQRAVPVIEVDGEMIIGFDEEKLKKALKLDK